MISIGVNSFWLHSTVNSFLYQPIKKRTINSWAFQSFKKRRGIFIKKSCGLCAAWGGLNSSVASCNVYLHPVIVYFLFARLFALQLHFVPVTSVYTNVLIFLPSALKIWKLVEYEMFMAIWEPLNVLENSHHKSRSLQQFRSVHTNFLFLYW